MQIPIRHLILPILISISLITGCTLSGSDDANRDVFGVWYQIVDVETEQAGPDKRITGWYFSRDQKSPNAIGALHPLGIEGETGRLSLIDDAHLPSFRAQIHRVENDYMIIDHFGYINLAAGPVPFYNLKNEGLKDLYLTQDTVRYTATPDKLFLDGTYFNGTWKRGEIGSEVSDPVHSGFSVLIDGELNRNLVIAEAHPTAFISISNQDELVLRAAMGGKNITISIPGFTGPGSYEIGGGQATYSQFGFDTLSPAYTTLDSKPGTLHIEPAEGDSTRYSGTFSFTAYLENGDTFSPIDFTEGSFDLPLLGN